MALFADFMAELAQRRGIRRQPDGGLVSYRFKIEATASLTVITDELNPRSSARVMSEPWPTPPTAAAHMEFMRAALGFNRNALHYLHCGIQPDPDQSGQYRLLWQVPALERPAEEWQRDLRMFATLVGKAWAMLPTPGGKLARKDSSADDHHMIYMP